MSDVEEPERNGISEQHIQTVSLMVLAGVAGIFLVYWLRPVLVPFVVACFIVSGVGPLLSYFEERFNVSRVVAAGMAFLFGVAVMGIFGLTISLSIIDLAKNAKDYRTRVRQLVDKMDNTFSTDFLNLKSLGRGDNASKDYLSGDDEASNSLTPFDSSEGESVEKERVESPVGRAETPAVPAAEGSQANANEETNQAEIDEGDVAISDVEDSNAEDSNAENSSVEDRDVEDAGAEGLASKDESEPGSDDGAVSGAAAASSETHISDNHTVRVHSRASPVSSVRMQEATELVDAFVRDGISVVLQSFLNLVSTSIVVLIYVFFLLLGKPGYARTGTMREIDTQIRSYLSLKTVISIGTGAVFGLALRMFGVPMALSFGVLAFLLNFIPNIGPIVASLLPIPLILLDPSGNIWWMISVILVTSTIQLISGNVVEPKLMGNSSDLHPVTILLGLMFWGMMWGIIGMFLATPITAAMKIVFERFEPTHQIANIMAGRWEGLEEELSKATGGQ